MDDPEAFLQSLRGKRIVLDEEHRLQNPSELLKMAADYFPDTKILATGSSTLGVSARFKDTLAGRKTELWLTPMISPDLPDFDNTDLTHRLLRGGLPSFFVPTNLPEQDFQEWMDEYGPRISRSSFGSNADTPFNVLQNCYSFRAEEFLRQHAFLVLARSAERPLITT